MLNNLLENAFDELRAALNHGRGQENLLLAAGRLLAQRLTDGATVFLCGNGGSAAEAQHLAGELVGRFLLERPGLPARALTADSAILTAIGNDYGYEEVFVRQIRAMGRPGDVLWGLSTSGRSPNVLKALAAAREMGLKTIFMRGPAPGGEEVADLVIPAPGDSTPRIQEMHLFYGHLLCQMVEKLIFGGPEES
jgi:D-sedoheptulose 7-phosphate isomerase